MSRFVPRTRFNFKVLTLALAAAACGSGAMAQSLTLTPSSAAAVGGFPANTVTWITFPSSPPAAATVLTGTFTPAGSSGNSTLRLAYSGTPASGNAQLVRSNPPTFSLAGFGQTNQYAGSGNGVVLYSRGGMGGTSATATLADMELEGPDGRKWQFHAVLADGESTDRDGESFGGTTNGGGWQAIGQLPPVGTPVANTLTNSGSTFTVAGVGSTGNGAPAHVLSSLNPTSVTGTLVSRLNRQGLVFGIQPLVPEVRVTCDPASPAAATKNCTVTVTNPPLGDTSLTLTPQAGLDPASPCFATPMVFNATQTTGTCAMISTTTGEVTVPATPVNVPGWIVVPGTVTVSGLVPVPAGGPVTLLLTSLGLVAVVARQRRRSKA